MTSPLHPAVRETWCAFNEPFEGLIDHAYLDSHKPPLRTVGIGCAITSFDEWMALDWLDADDGLQADSMTIACEWDRLGALEGGHVASFYRGPIRLAVSAIDALALRRYDAIADAILARWPDAASWSDDAFKATASMGYALGTSSTVRPGLLSPEWPKLHAALDAQDWETAARECFMQGAGLERRNAANAALFRAAAGASG